MRMPKGLSGRRLAGLAGTLLAIACGIFFLRTLGEVLGRLDGRGPSAAAIAVTVIACPVYAATLCLIAAGWTRLAAAGTPEDGAPKDGAMDIPAARIFAIQAVTQFGKYLPGNLFHYASRHAMLAKDGFSHRRLIAAALAENLLLILAAASAGLLLVGLFPFPLSLDLPKWAAIDMVAGSAPLRIGLTIAALLVLLLVLERVVIRLTTLPLRGSFGLYALFFLLQGLIFALLLATVSGRVPPVGALGVVPLSWIAGFVIPGAPGGLGIREAVLLFALGPFAGTDTVVLTTVLYRIVTFGGDALLFGAGLWLIRRYRSTGEAAASRS
ncbi:hypothetical protein HDIA_4531 [Hartmannibacter diazotrophicus]|uniref:Uncharacterized protein n=1 Tax=Hartmannibacter diazotrophicus TaxID=1482074 RepID=A0A2C9DCL7_9HYPH|nr:lysylphosphatidylglycerol synthase domain-containing protein [Hartmannibacter diazotrophicus]SON58072.1 hypothetical protein HDIA_4531 [Hartmannibacter diazotrophicus]